MHVMFVGGGTLGSVTPLLGVHEAMVRGVASDAEFSWLGTAEGPERVLVEKAGIPFYVVPTAKFRRYFHIRNVTDFFRFVWGFFRSIKLLKKLRPNVLVTSGSFVAVPVVYAARFLRVPIHVHQLDIIPGLANRLAIPFASTVTVSFPELVERMKKNLGAKNIRVEHTQTPLRSIVFEGDAVKARRRFGIPADRPVVFVLGGGTGAVGLNSLVVQALPELLRFADVVHLTGKGKMVSVAQDGYHPVEFMTEDIVDCYAAASVVVARAGIGTFAELAALGKPMVIVPMPNSHQEQNAEYFLQKGACTVLRENKVTQQEFAREVKKILTDDALREHMSSCGRALSSREASEKVARAIITIAK